MVRAGQTLPVAQGLQAARRPARPDDQRLTADTVQPFLAALDSGSSAHLLVRAKAPTADTEDTANGISAHRRRDGNQLRGTGKG